MPSDHTSMAARHRARTLSRAKSLRKHQRWLAQHQERTQSQPDLHLGGDETGKENFHFTHAKRAVSLRGPRSRGASTSMCDVSAWKKAGWMGGGFASSTTLASISMSESPFPPLTAVWGFGLGITVGLPWKEVNYNRSRHKIGLSTRHGPVLTPYPATTTREVSESTVEIDGGFKGGEAGAVQVLRLIRHRYNTVKTTTYSSRSLVRQPDPLSQSVDLGTNDSLLTTGSDTTFDTDTISSSQASDSDALMYLYAPSVKTRQPLQEQSHSQQVFKSPPRTHIWAHPKRGRRETEREERRPLLPPPSQRQSRERERSPQRHQRHRHPRLVFPCVPGQDHHSSAVGVKSNNVRTGSDDDDAATPSEGTGKTRKHQHRHHAKPRTLKVREFVDGYWRWVSVAQSNLLPHYPHGHDNIGAAESYVDSEGDEVSHFIPGKTLWSQARSSLTSLAAATSNNLKVARAVSEKLSWGFWPAGPRRVM